jgi:chemotaxis protein CheC
MNIGAGNAVTALERLLKCPVDLIIPRVYVLPVTQVSSILDKPISLVACTRMEMIGDLSGDLFFIVPKKDAKELVRLAEKAMPGPSKLPGQKPEEVELSAIAEIGNILSGVYLAAIHDFCGLNIYHNVPILAIDMIQPLLDEALARISRRILTAILIENEFILEEHHIRTLMLIIPSVKSIKRLIDALGQAKKVYGSA